MTHHAPPWAPAPPTYCTHCDEPITRHTGGVCRACGRPVCTDCGEDDREEDWWCRNQRWCDEDYGPSPDWSLIDLIDTTDASDPIALPPTGDLIVAYDAAPKAAIRDGVDSGGLTAVAEYAVRWFKKYGQGGGDAPQ